MKESRALTRARTFVGFLETWRYGVLLLVAVLTFGSLFLMRDLRFDNSDESFFTDDDPAVVAIERFRELFGNEDFVYVAVRNGGDIFDRDTLRLLDSLALARKRTCPTSGRSSGWGRRNTSALTGTRSWWVPASKRSLMIPRPSGHSKKKLWPWTTS